MTNTLTSIISQIIQTMIKIQIKAHIQFTYIYSNCRLIATHLSIRNTDFVLMQSVTDDWTELLTLPQNNLNGNYWDWSKRIAFIASTISSLQMNFGFCFEFKSFRNSFFTQSFEIWEIMWSQEQWPRINWEKRKKFIVCRKAKWK